MNSIELTALIPEPCLPVSAVVRATGGERSLRNALRSIVSQTRPPAEVLVLAAGGDDVAALAAQHGARVVVCDEASPARARAVGIAAAKQPWIAFLEGEAVWEPRKLERQWDAVRLQADVALVFTDHLTLGDREAPPRLAKSPAFRKLGRRAADHAIAVLRGDDVALAFADEQLFALSSVLVRRALCAGVPPCDVGLRGVEERDFLLRIVRAQQVAAVEEPLTHLIASGDPAKTSYRLALEAMETLERIESAAERFADDVVRSTRGLTEQRVIRAAKELVRAGDPATALALLRRSGAVTTAAGAGLAVVAGVASSQAGHAVLEHVANAARGLRRRAHRPVLVPDEAAVRRAPPERLAALTFDDGPDPVVTPLILDQLVRLGVPATFFPVGVDARRYPAVCRRLAAAGMELGNHSLTHSRLSVLDAAAQQREIVEGARLIAEASGAPVRWFRPPYGDYDATTLAVCAASRQRMALWNVDSDDWSEAGEEKLVRSVADAARAPAVILLHASLLPTVAALKGIVELFRANGFAFVTLSELAERVTIGALNSAPRVQLDAGRVVRLRAMPSLGAVR